MTELESRSTTTTSGGRSARAIERESEGIAMSHGPGSCARYVRHMSSGGFPLKKEAKHLDENLEIPRMNGRVNESSPTAQLEDVLERQSREPLGTVGNQQRQKERKEKRTTAYEHDRVLRDEQDATQR
jgi:hypothetical protein